jgi:hypothetical protein
MTCLRFFRRRGAPLIINSFLCCLCWEFHLLSKQPCICRLLIGLGAGNGRAHWRLALGAMSTARCTQTKMALLSLATTKVRGAYLAIRPLLWRSDSILSYHEVALARCFSTLCFQHLSRLVERLQLATADLLLPPVLGLFWFAFISWYKVVCCTRWHDVNSYYM